MARNLGIRSSIKKTTQQGVGWLYAADRSGAFKIHSVAVSLGTGELIYHDTFPSAQPPLYSAFSVSRKLVVSRAWMSRLGWPSPQMPIHSPISPQEKSLGSVFSEFDWGEVGPADEAAAVVQIGQGGQIVDAHLWPPIQAQNNIATRSYLSAWALVRDRKTPVAVAVAGGQAHGPARLAHATLMYVLTSRTGGPSFLVPAYRFSGQVNVSGSGPASWYAIVPAVPRKR
jgi:hypothetical protein